MPRLIAPGWTRSVRPGRGAPLSCQWADPTQRPEAATWATALTPAAGVGLWARDRGGETADLVVNLLLWTCSWLTILLCLRAVI